MKFFLRIGCAVGLLLIAVSWLPLSAMGGENKEAKPEAQIAQEQAARQRIIAKVRKERIVIEAQKKAAAEAKAAAVASQSSSSGSSSSALAEERESVLPMPLAGTVIRGLDEEEEKQESKEAVKKEVTAVVSVETKKPIEELATIKIKAADKSEAKVALALLLQLQPIAATFDEQHKAEAKDYKEAAKLCNYGQGDDKVERVAGCPVCDTVAQAWFDGIQNKKQLERMGVALLLVYVKKNSKTPRDIVKYLVEKLDAVDESGAKVYAESDLKNLWSIAFKLAFPPLATAAAIQLQFAQEAFVKKAAQEVKKEEQEATATKARVDFVEERDLAKPLVEQMIFEKAYAEGKAPALSLRMLQVYSFLPMQVGATVDEVWGVIKTRPQYVALLVAQLPLGEVKTELLKLAMPAVGTFYAQAPDFIKLYQQLPVGREPGDSRSLVLDAMDKHAEGLVADQVFDKTAFEAIPEGHFKYLVRVAYFKRNHTPIDQFPIEKVMTWLVPGVGVYLQYLEPIDVAWLNDELYLLNEKQAIKRLYLEHNKLAALPANFLQECAQLQELDLNYNELAALPANFLQGCAQLQELHLNNNKLAALPANFLQGCAQLQKLYLYENKLAALPDNFLQGCAQLQVLDLNHNELAALPDNFLQECAQLQELYLYDNKLAALPVNFLQSCSRLKLLSFCNNPWKTCPEALAKTLRARGVNVVSF